MAGPRVRILDGSSRQSSWVLRVDTGYRGDEPLLRPYAWLDIFPSRSHVERSPTAASFSPRLRRDDGAPVAPSIFTPLLYPISLPSYLHLDVRIDSNQRLGT